MVLSDTVVAKINLITPQLSTNFINFIIPMPFLLTRRIFKPLALIRSNTVNKVILEEINSKVQYKL